MKKLRKLGTRFRKSTKAWQQFKAIQENHLERGAGSAGDESADDSDGEEDCGEGHSTSDDSHTFQVPDHTRVLRLLRPMKTRWNSWFFCLKRAMVLRDSIDEYLLQENNHLDDVDGDEEDKNVEIGRNWSISPRTWRSFWHLLDALEPIKIISTELESDMDVTISVVLVCVCRLLYHDIVDCYDDENREIEVKLKFWEGFRAKLLESMDDVEQVFLWTTCAALDGRHKSLPFLKEMWDHRSDWPNLWRKYKTVDQLTDEV